MAETQQRDEPRETPRRLASDFFGRLEWADAVLLLYVAAVARVCFWAVGSNRVAWPLSVLASAAVVHLYVSTRERREGSGRQFWLVVALPLVAVYLMRAAIPDTSFDVMNNRLFHSERALWGPLFAPGDWFPTNAPFSPVPDIATGLSRRLLGYRLGTALNLLAILWSAQIVDRLLRPYVAGRWRRAACVLLVALTEHVLFEINEYMIDVLVVPLLLEAITLAARGNEVRGFRADAIRCAFLLGLAAAFKLTSATLALPLALLFIPRLATELRAAPARAAATSGIAAVVFALPLLPFAIYIHAQTGNPVFPLYNAIFQSPHWTSANYLDPRWGPKGLWETITWPLTSVAHPERLSELKVYSGRFTLGTIASLAGLVLARRDRLVLALCVVFLVDSLLWGASTGYIRYALHLEFVAGALVVCLSASLARRAAQNRSGLGRSLAALPLATLVAQAAAAVVYTGRTEWSGRPTVFDEPRTHFREARLALRDHSLRSFLPERERALFANVEAWIASGIKTPAVQVMLRPDVPTIGLRAGEFFMTEESRRSFDAAVARVAGRRVYSLCLTSDVDEATKAIEARGLRVVNSTPVSIPYYSRGSVRIPMLLLEVRPAKKEL